MGYVGPREAAPLLLEGLRRLEYRGYDSAGIAVANGAIDVRKAEGKIERLAVLLDAEPLFGTIGIGHTRWATHGEPSDVNAHPHTDPSGKFVVVHNGIIENFTSLREMLEDEGHVFTSQTDTEILAHLVARAYDGDLVAAVRAAVAQAEGAYALVVMSAFEPGRIIAVRRISPLVVGLGDGETFLASDIPAALHHTRDFLIIEDGELVIVTADGATVEKIDGGPVAREPIHIEWDAAQAEKGGYDHFMLKEINEQPAVITETIAGRLDEDGTAWLEDVNFDDDFARSLDSIWITACGTAYHAGLVGREIFQRVLRIPTYVEFAHEMRYADPLVGDGSLTIAISQSGETADTLAAARLAQSRGSRLMALTNVVGSTLARDADDILYTRAGPEIAVASTKAYLAMLIAQYLLALRIGRAAYEADASWQTAIPCGLALREMGEIERARETFEEALSHDPEDISARLEIGDMYLEDDQWDEAAGWYEQVLAREPDHSWAKSSLAYCDYQQGREEAAAVTLNEQRRQSCLRAERLVERLLPYSGSLPEPGDARSARPRFCRKGSCGRGHALGLLEKHEKA